MQLKGAALNNFLKQPKLTHANYLVYGPNQGLVSVTQDALFKHARTIDPRVELVRLSGSEIAGSPEKLEIELTNKSMFANGKVILVQLDARARERFGKILPAMTLPLDFATDKTALIIASDNLPATSKIRKHFETSPHCLGVPCYEDDDRALESLIERELANFKLDSDARDLLLQSLASDRLLSTLDLRQLATYCEHERHITRLKVRELFDEPSEVIASEIVDACLLGRTDRALALLPKSRALGDLFRVFLLQFHQIASVRCELSGGSNIGDAMKYQRPPIFFKRQAAFRSALHLWSLENCRSASTQLQQYILLERRYPTLAQSLAQHAVISLSQSSLRHARTQRSQQGT